MEFNLKFLFFILFFVCPVWLSAEEFVFRNTTLSDADWTVLERAEGPVSVCAALTDVDDEDMKRFATLRTLEELDVSYCGITETGLEALKTLPNLKTLWCLYCKKLPPEAVRTIAEMKNLEKLIFFCWFTHEFTENELRHLGKLPKLRFLALNNCSASLETLENLLPMDRLKKLDLMDYKQKVTPSEVEKFKSRWPECDIFVDYPEKFKKYKNTKTQEHQKVLEEGV